MDRLQALKLRNEQSSQFGVTLSHLDQAQQNDAQSLGTHGTTLTAVWHYWHHGSLRAFEHAYPPPGVSQLSLLTSHLSSLTSRISSLTSHLSPLTSHLSHLTSHLLQLEASLGQNMKTIEANFSAVEQRIKALGK